MPIVTDLDSSRRIEDIPNLQPKDKHGVHAVTPDPTKYFKDGGGVRIPRSTSDGLSKGFKVKPGVVNVVDIEAMGATCSLSSAVSVDMSAVKAADIKRALSKADGGEESLMDIYQELSKTSSTVPAAKNNAVSQQPRKQATTVDMSVATLDAPMMPGAVPPQQPVYNSDSAKSGDNTAFLENQILSLQNQLFSMQRMFLSNVKDSVEPEPVAEEEEKVKSASMPINEFTNSVGLSYLTEEPVKPTRQVFFNLGPIGGKLSVSYHAVIETNSCLVLVYDQRYESGMQYIPPKADFDNPIPLKVTLPDSDKTYEVLSFDFNFVLGPLEICVLIVSQPEK